MSKVLKDLKIPVPAYIVTYSDMITLLLTFFVMLLSLAETQVDEHKFMAGRYSFKSAVADFGLSGFLINKNSGPGLEHPKPKYRIDEGEDEENDRSIDVETEKVRRILLEVERMMKISPSHICGMDKTFLQPGINFQPGSWDIDADAQKKISALCEQIKVDYTLQEPILYVLGLAADAKSDRQQWIVSSQRAKAVADAIRTQIPENLKWPVFCWGAANGGEWVGRNGQTTQNNHILIAVLTETK
ncbi:MAG: OmpA family protein [Planctomycetes bacterium]|nr:OmpA family protein [Planctomycetota bacterium]